jgi:1,4-dihydroxy-2-naphthoate octaprenyltransferase
MDSLRLFLKISRPLPVFGVILTFGLGAGIARYLGATIDWEVYFLGQVWVTLLQLSMYYLGDYFAHPADIVNPRRTPFSERSDAIGPGKLPINLALWAGLACLAVDTSITGLLINRISLPPAVYLMMFLIFMGALSYSVPPLRLASSGYGELLMSIWVANLVPALAYLLQTGEWHRLLPMTTFPLLLLHLAMMLAFEFPDYAVDVKFEKSTLLVRLGWQRGMYLHNFLELGGFVLLSLAWSIGLPYQIAVPALIVLLVGGFQVWMMNRIEAGAQPNWLLFTVTAAASFGMTAYLLAYGFWTRLAF